jgi:hypothetical protein
LSESVTVTERCRATAEHFRARDGVPAPRSVRSASLASHAIRWTLIVLTLSMLPLGPAFADPLQIETHAGVKIRVFPGSGYFFDQFASPFGLQEMFLGAEVTLLGGTAAADDAGPPDMDSYSKGPEKKLDVLPTLPTIVPTTGKEIFDGSSSASAEQEAEAWATSIYKGVPFFVPLLLPIPGGSLTEWAISSSSEFGGVFEALAGIDVTATLEVLARSNDASAPAQAVAGIDDPFPVSGLLPGGIIDLEVALDASTIAITSGTAGRVAATALVFHGGTDIPDHEILYSGAILILDTGAGTGTIADYVISAFFASDPLLGLDDATVLAAILGSFSYQGNGVFHGASVPLFDGFFDPPDSFPDFHLFFNQSLHASTDPSQLPSFGSLPMPRSGGDSGAGGTNGTVPEPGALLLYAAGLFALALRRRRGTPSA